MFLCTLITVMIPFMIAGANLFSSGSFLVRISSMKRQHVRYCFTELPYLHHKTSDYRCLKSGQLNVTNRTETVFYFRLENMTTAYLTILLDISNPNGDSNEEKSQRFSYRSVIDGSRSAQRTAVANGLVFEFITVCNRPYFGLMCAQYCADGADAHHVCDSSGKKVCLPGWTGKECTIAIKDVIPTRIDDIPTFSSIQSPTSRSTGASQPPDYLTPTLKSRRDEPRTRSTAPSTALTSSPSIAIRFPVKVPTFFIQTVDGVAFPTHPISRTFSTSTTRLAGLSPDDRISAVLTTSSTLTSNISGCYTVLRIWRDDNADSSLFATLLVMTVMTSLTTVGFALRKLMRTPCVQNLFNNCWAKILTTVNVDALKRNRVADKTSKMFIVDIKELSETLAVYSSKKPDHRYSLQPTGEPIKSGKQLFVNDTSMLRSSTYHEIDSFLVSPTRKRQLETLV